MAWSVLWLPEPNMRDHHPTSHLAALTLCALTGCAGPYSLVRPMPREQMREMATDRPDMTESPLSVEPGHVQLEFDTVAYEVSRTPSATDHVTRVGTVNTRLGLGMRTDLQLVVTPMVWRAVATQDASHEDDVGFGDTVLRLKVNLRGNEEDGFAIGLLPFVVAPTSTNGVGDAQFSGGLAVPMGIALHDRLDLGMMVQVELGEGELGTLSYRTLETITLGVGVVGPFAVFVEVAHATVFDDGATTFFELHGGMTYALSSDMRLDVGVFGTLVGEGRPLLVFLGGTYRH